MPNSLIAVANMTGEDATFTNTNHTGDQAALPAGVITHTGGQDGDYVLMPKCSDSEFFADHHLTIAADNGAWAASLWGNDQADMMLGWNSQDAYSDGHYEQGSRNTDECTVVVTLDAAGNPVIAWNRFD